MPIGSVSWRAEGMLTGEAQRSPGGGWEFVIRNQLFHGSKPLGWIRRWVVVVDGVSMQTNDIEILIRDQRISAVDLPTVSEIWWYPREALTVRLPTAPLPTSTVEVRVELHLSTFFFTPEIDRNDIYPTIPLVLTKRLSLKEAA